MLRIRLSRTGKTNNAQFRITVADGHRAPSGKFIEILGYYNPHTKEKVFKKERIEYWIAKGAQPSSTVHNFLIDAGILKGGKVTSWVPKKKELTEEEKKAQAQAKADTPAA
jgi:small subunit ribosomal protein S16